MTRLQPVHRAERRSLWLEEALAPEPGAERVEPLGGAHRADVVVVGGGYTGLWTALRLKELEPSLDVLLLEADLCGSGASGRNGGFTQSWWTKLNSLLAVCGEEEALRLCHESEGAVRAIGEFCRRHGIDAHFVQGGWLWTATTPLHVGKWEAVIRAVEARGLTHIYRRLTPEEVAARTGSPVHVAGVFETITATVQPALLARGLRQVALERGVRIAERSPVVEIERGAAGSPPVVRTERAAVVAERVALATNAWAADFPELRRAMIVISSDMIATAPMPDRLRQIGWTGGEAISDARLMVQYYRTTRDGRIAIGKGSGTLTFRSRVTPDLNHSPRREREVTAGFHRHYPMLTDVPISHAWAGPIDRTEDGLLACGYLSGGDRIAYAVGYSGNGVGPSYVGARILAALALGLKDEWATTPLARGPRRRFPPEPVRYFGGQLVRAAVARKEDDEERGTPPDPLIRRLAAFAPSGMTKGAGRGAETTPSPGPSPNLGGGETKLASAPPPTLGEG